MIEAHSLIIDDDKTLLEICGVNDKNLRKIENITGNHVFSSGNEIHYQGDNFLIIERMIKNMIAISQSGRKHLW